MTTKIEIQNKAKEEIQNASIELEKLNEKHKKYEEEHNKEREHNEKQKEIYKKIDKLEEKKWEGNFGNKDDWYYSRIPQKFDCLIKTAEDKDIFKRALTEIANENEEKIKQTKEYKSLEQQKDKLSWYSFSKEHLELDKEIDNLKWGIDYNNRIIREVEDRGKLIEYSKNLKKREEREKQEKERKAKLTYFKESIIKLNIINNLK